MMDATASGSWRSKSPGEIIEELRRAAAAVGAKRQQDPPPPFRLDPMADPQEEPDFVRSWRAAMDDRTTAAHPPEHPWYTDYKHWKAVASPAAEDTGEWELFTTGSGGLVGLAPRYWPGRPISPHAKSWQAAHAKLQALVAAR